MSLLARITRDGVVHLVIIHPRTGELLAKAPERPVEVWEEPLDLEERTIAGERRLGIVDDDGVWWMPRREPGERRPDSTRSDRVTARARAPVRDRQYW